MPSSACYGHLRDPHSFPPRRSSDLAAPMATPGPCRSRSFFRGRPRLSAATTSRLKCDQRKRSTPPMPATTTCCAARRCLSLVTSPQDRKSTRLNSSHRCNSYAVFCLLRPPPRSTLFPSTPLFRSGRADGDAWTVSFALFLQGTSAFERGDHEQAKVRSTQALDAADASDDDVLRGPPLLVLGHVAARSEEHTSELQSPM